MTELLAAFLLMMGYGPSTEQVSSDGGGVVATQGGGIPVKPPVSTS